MENSVGQSIGKKGGKVTNLDGTSDVTRDGSIDKVASDFARATVTNSIKSFLSLLHTAALENGLTSGLSTVSDSCGVRLYAGSIWSQQVKN